MKSRAMVHRLDPFLRFSILALTPSIISTGSATVQAELVMPTSIAWVQRIVPLRFTKLKYP